MHGTEHRKQDLRAALCLLPRPLFDGCGSMLASRLLDSYLGPVARNGLSLACNGCPIAGPPFQGQRSWPAASCPADCVPTRSTFCSPLPRFDPRLAASTLRPVACLPLNTPGFSSVSTPLRGLFPSGSKRSIRFGSGQARLPNSPDFLSLPAAVSITRFRLRINVPGSLRFRRLAVPQTSWNLLHNAPSYEIRQIISGCERRISSRE